MTRADTLGSSFPELGRRLNKIALAALPTPVQRHSLSCRGQRLDVWFKQDNLTGKIYGGNKVRKLEYLFSRVRQKNCPRVATFGAVSSNHALATALYARKLQIDPICFLSHQTKTPAAALSLNMHLANKSEIVAFGGSYAERVKTLRRHLWNRGAAVIPMGGSSWLGTVGFVNAGLELAEQITAGELPAPGRVYIATGTMGTAAGLALGLALAGLPTDVHAVRVSPAAITNELVLRRLMRKTAHMLHRLAPSFPAGLAERARVTLRHDYFAPGYAKSNEKTDAAVRLAADQAGITLESTYTGKALAALLDDLRDCTARGEIVLFWNSYNSAPLPTELTKPADVGDLSDEFLSYFC